MRRHLAWLALLAACAPAAATSPDAGAPTSQEPTIMLIAIAGQSNALGSALVDDVTLTTGLDALYSNVTLVQRMAGNVGSDPPVLTDIPAAALGPRYVALEDGSPLANGRMGVELSMGRQLDRAWPRRVRIVKFALGGSGLEEHWKPTAVYPTVGPNISAQFITWVRQQEIAFDTRLGAIVWIQGNNDAGNAAEAAAYAANMAALLAAWRAAFPNVVLVFDRLHSGMSGAHNATVRAQQAAFAAANALRGVRMLNVDDLDLRDDSHFTSDAFVELGGRFAQALEELMPTTYKLIRERQVGVAKALTPSLLPNAGRFTLVPDHEFRTFEDWADGAMDPFRVFDVRLINVPGEEGDIPGTDARHVTHAEELVVAYPQLVTWGGDRVEYLIEADTSQLLVALGTRGYLNYEALGTGEHSCRAGGDPFIEERPTCRIVHIPLTLDYDRSI